MYNTANTLITKHFPTYKSTLFISLRKILALFFTKKRASDTVVEHSIYSISCSASPRLTTTNRPTNLGDLSSLV